ncbi:NUDIX domain-containing protein, partial [Candidatus Woesearchaeota archaeon]|nr:NUDIX domain-containing protein [Candidatus Woesearchaeota archaeon]
MKHLRRRGTAIIETQKGILVTASWHKTFILPGGTTKRGESRKHATIRELREETTLQVCDIKYLFTWLESESTRHRAEHKVFLVKATGTPKPDHHEVHYIDYWNPSSSIKLSWETKRIINKYEREHKHFKQEIL